LATNNIPSDSTALQFFEAEKSISAVGVSDENPLVIGIWFVFLEELRPKSM
jgi:hypothetical protein